MSKNRLWNRSSDNLARGTDFALNGSNQIL